MIYFVLHKYHRYAVVNFLDAWGRDVRPRVEVLAHQDLCYATKLPHGTYVFGDADRLTADELRCSASVADQLMARGCRVLNHPSKVAWRHELCRRLEGDGLNAYRCFRTDHDWSGVKFPAFVRREDDHGSLRRDLLNDVDSIRKTIAENGGPSKNLLVIEYIDTRGSDGLYRKYSALRVGGRPFPRHLLFSKDWVVKYADLVDPHLLEEEDRYLDNFGGDAAHEAQVMRAFELAGVEYGRIDYSLDKNGRVQVWEINLSPNLGSPPNKIALGRIESQWKISARIVEAIGQLDEGKAESNGSDNGTVQIAIRHDAGLLAKLGVTRGDGALRLAGKLFHRAERFPGLRSIASTYRRALWLATK